MSAAQEYPLACLALDILFVLGSAMVYAMALRTGDRLLAGASAFAFAL